MERTIKGIVFDLGGVLITGEGYYWIPRTSRALGIAPRKLRRLVAAQIPKFQRGEESPRAFWARIAQRGDGSGAGIGAADFFKKDYLAHAPVRQDAVRLALRLAKSYPLGIISNTNAQHAAINRRRAIFRLFQKHFRTILLSSEVHMVKPERRIFLLAARRMRIPPRELLFIDDEREFVRAARRAGFRAIRFESLPRLRKRLRALHIL